MDRRRGRRQTFTLAIAAAGWLLGASPAEAARLTSLRIDSEPGEWIGGGEQETYEPDGFHFTATRNSRGGVRIEFWRLEGDDWYLDFAAPGNAPLTPGVYLGATRFPFQSSDAPGLSVTSGDRYCNEVDGEFEVLEAAYDAASGVVTAFRARFEQHCDHSIAALFGDIRYQADVQVELTGPRRTVGPAGDLLEVAIGGVPVDGGAVALRASGLPDGAVFTDMGGGTGHLAWTPGAGQTGEHHVSFYGRTSGTEDRLDTTLLVGTLIHVPADQPSIQAAIEAALPGSRIRVSPGTYRENLDYLGKPLRLESEAGPEATILDGGGVLPVVMFRSGEGRDSILTGFTVRHGVGFEDRPIFGTGGGIAIHAASPTISGNVIADNEACDGGGIGAQVSGARIEGNRIERNLTRYCGGHQGGGIHLSHGGRAEILDNVITDNIAGREGGGISLDRVARVDVWRNRILRNEGDSGGGIHALEAGMDLVGNLIAANHAFDTGGVLAANSSYYEETSTFVSNTIALNDGGWISGLRVYEGGSRVMTLVNNLISAVPGQTALLCEGAGYTHVDSFRNNNAFSSGRVSSYDGTCMDVLGYHGNISVDPAYQCPDTGNYHPGPGSGVIDVGSDGPLASGDRDLSGSPRALDGDQTGGPRIDIGAFEFDPAAPVDACAFAFCPDDFEVTTAPGWRTEYLRFPDPIVPPNATVTCVPPMGTFLPGGTHVVTCTAVHSERGTASCSFTVRVHAPPLNDHDGYPTPISGLPFTDRLDTREATHQDDDRSCAGPEASVWYSVRPLSDVILVADTSGSSYPANIAVMKVSGEERACGPGPHTFEAKAGEWFLIEVASDQPGGGDLVFSLTGRSPLDLRVTIDRDLVPGPDPGSVRIGGRADCSRPSSATLTGVVTPLDGGGPLTFSSQVECGKRGRWEAVIPQAAERFKVRERVDAQVVGEAVQAATGDQASTTVSGFVALRSAKPKRTR